MIFSTVLDRRGKGLRRQFPFLVPVIRITHDTASDKNRLSAIVRALPIASELRVPLAFLIRASQEQIKEIEMVAINNSLKLRFSLGRIVVTTGALSAIADAGQSPTSSRPACPGRIGAIGCGRQGPAMMRPVNRGDADRQERIMSAYRTAKNVKIWVITEATREVTTLLLPEEY